MTRITVTAPDGVPEVRKGDDLAALLLAALDSTTPFLPAEASPPSAEASVPSAEASPPSAEASPPSAEASPPSVEASPPSVEASLRSAEMAAGDVSSDAPDVSSDLGDISANAPDASTDVRDISANAPDASADGTDVSALRDGDIVVVTSKVVSKAEGQVREGIRDDALPGETTRMVARRGPTQIVRSRLGLTMAAAGIDASNVEAGHIALLPLDPDASARALRATLRDRTGANVGVIITDTAGRAWRDGQTDIAIGAAGLEVLESFAGQVDAHGNDLVVTAPAVVDEIASAAEISQGKLGARPFAVLRGRADLVREPGDDGPGASALIRPEGSDFFGFGAREAVVRALKGAAEDQAPFGAPASTEELAAAVAEVTGTAPVPDADGLRVVGADHAVIAALAFSHGWRCELAENNRGATSLLLPLTT